MSCYHLNAHGSVISELFISKGEFENLFPVLLCESKGSELDLMCMMVLITGPLGAFCSPITWSWTSAFIS